MIAYLGASARVTRCVEDGRKGLHSLREVHRDAIKAEENLQAHGIDFREAATVFDDPLSTTFPGADHSVGERRFLIVGMSALGRILVVSHTETGDTIRIISARAATRRERRFYEEDESNPH